MSENPYTPPGSDLGREPQVGTGDIDIGQCLSDAWSRTWENFPLWLGVGAVAILASVLAMVTVVGIFLVLPVLMWGGFRFTLRMHDGGAEFGDLFQGFEVYGTALASMLVIWLVTFVVGLVGQSVQLTGDLTGIGWLTGLGLLINLFVSLMVTPRLIFAYFYTIDRGLGPMDAISEAWRATAPVKWKGSC